MITQRFGGALALAVLGLSLTGGGVALAATTDAPIPGSTKCTDAVNGTTAVTTAKADLATAQETLQGAQNKLAVDKAAVPFVQATVDADNVAINNDQVAVATAQRAYDRAVAQATRALCTGTATTTPAPTTDPVAPAPVPFVPHTRTEAVIDGEIDALSCSSSNSDLQAIDRQIAARQVQHQTTAEVTARLNAKIATLNCSTGAVAPATAARTAKDCGCVTAAVPPVTEAPVTEAPILTQAPVTLSPAVSYSAVVPTQDDNSVATTSGSQIADVPVGSAQTGAV